MKYEVRVGKIGTVYSGQSATRANETFCQYRDFSRARAGRAAGEHVTLLADGTIIEEWVEEGVPAQTTTQV